MNSAENTPDSASQPLDERVNNRSQRPSSEAFKAFMASNWAPSSQELPGLDDVAPHAANRRKAISGLFKGERLVLPAGPLKVRSNDCDYRFRPHSGFAHLTGLGLDHEPDAVLILEPVAEGTGDGGGHHRATLYFRPLAGRVALVSSRSLLVRPTAGPDRDTPTSARLVTVRAPMAVTTPRPDPASTVVPA